MAIILLIKTEDGQVTELPLLDKIKIGRSGASDFKILDSKMSGIHCSFEVNGKGELIFKDLESTNGSFLNNSKIIQTVVRINDIIKIGNTLIRIDEMRLNPRERTAIGVSTISNRDDKSLPVIDAPDSKIALPKISPVKKGGVVLKKELKGKKPISNWAGGSDNIIEQEESSGYTKMLTIDKNKKKK